MPATECPSKHDKGRDALASQPQKLGKLQRQGPETSSHSLMILQRSTGSCEILSCFTEPQLPNVQARSVSNTAALTEASCPVALVQITLAVLHERLRTQEAWGPKGNLPQTAFSSDRAFDERVGGNTKFLKHSQRMNRLRSNLGSATPG